MKFRFRLMTDGAQSRPVSNVRARLIARADKAEFILAEIATNAYGYGIIAVPDIPKAELFLRLSSEWEMQIDRSYLRAPFAFEIKVPKAMADQAQVCHTLQWHNDPLDLDDIAAVPTAFADLGSGVFGEGYCGRIIPSDRMPEYSRLTHIRRIKDAGLDCKESGLTLYAGEALLYEVEHVFLGLSVGSLLKSTTLLPCEKVTVVVRNWQNRTVQQSTQSSDLSQQQTDTLSDTQSLNELVSQSANSFSVGLKASVSGKLGEAGSVNVGLGTGYSRSQADASIRQDLTRAMRATASAYRSERRVSIAEVNQTFAQQDSVRSFCNNNHCHTLHVSHRQVNENFQANVTLLGAQEVVFWPQQVEEFTPEKLACKRYLLEGNLLEPGLEACWDGFARDQARPAPSEATSGGTSGSGGKVSSLSMKVTIGKNGLAKGRPIFVTVKLRDGTTQKVEVIRANRWKKNAEYIETVNLSPAVDPEEIAQITIHNESLFAVKMTNIAFSFFDGGDQVLYSGPIQNGELRKNESDTFKVDYARGAGDMPLPPAPVPDPQVAQDALCAERLLVHINCNAHYYNQLLWLGVDPEERRCFFDNLLCRGRPLSDYLDPVPIGLSGCSLVFARIDKPFEEAVDAETTSELITLPTDGVHADAALGRCSTCETVTEGEFRDWEPGHCGCSEPAQIGGTPKPDGLNDVLSDGWGDLEDLIGNVPAGVKPSSVLAATLGTLVKQNEAILTALLKGLDAKDAKEPKQEG